jgi:hypothetical protein
MNDHRDPDLQGMRAEWQSLETPVSAQAATLRAYRERFGVMRSRRFWAPVAAAALAASVALMLIRVHPTPVEYRPVAQPRIIDLSQGERP